VLDLLRVGDGRATELHHDPIDLGGGAHGLILANCHNRGVISDDRLAPEGLAGADVVVESTAPEAVALAELLASEGARARLATPDELDRDSHAGVAFLDAWTPEVATRVAGLRAGGALVTCLADLVLARAGGRVVAVTGTAGKTTTTSLAGQLLRAAGVDVDVPAPGVSGNLWPDASLLDALEGTAPIVVELTSSHLALCHHSPHIAAVTSFWPDHLELHGSLAAYAHAKEAIVRGQRPQDWLVVPADGSCERFVAASAAQVARFSIEGMVEDTIESTVESTVERGAFLRGGRLVVRWEDEELELVDVTSLPLHGSCISNALAACAVALAAGAPPAALVDGLRNATVPAFRFIEVARIGGVPVYDDSMAGTPAKAVAALEGFPDDSIVLVAGGQTHGAAGPVHATVVEQELLEMAVAVSTRKAKHIIVFGPAASRLAELLPGSELADDLDHAIERAVAAAPGSQAVLIAPMFPIAPHDRDRVASLVRDFSPSARLR
jgi:UDP-N-acetylmuramoylalanine--D-glutamate ligase